MQNNSSQSRSIKNEQLVRDRNRQTMIRLRRFFQHDTSASTTLLDFVCECSNLDCVERIELTIKDYEAIHVRQDRFMIREKHLTPAAEKVVEQHSAYSIVEKYDLQA
jgi:hypothetical protein